MERPELKLAGKVFFLDAGPACWLNNRARVFGRREGTPEAEGLQSCWVTLRHVE